MTNLFEVGMRYTLNVKVMVDIDEMPLPPGDVSTLLMGPFLARDGAKVLGDNLAADISGHTCVTSCEFADFIEGGTRKLNPDKIGQEIEKHRAEVARLEIMLEHAERERT